MPELTDKEIMTIYHYKPHHQSYAEMKNINHFALEY